MINVSVFRLNLLRAGYLLLVVGLGLTIWPEILDPATTWSSSRGIVVCMLAAMSALAVLGLRYPLRMLPLLFFELGWKTLWLVRVAWPLWATHRLDAATAENAWACLVGAVFLAVIPWPYVFRLNVTQPADPWRRPRASAVSVRAV